MTRCELSVSQGVFVRGTHRCPAPPQTSSPELLGEVCVDLRSLRPDRLSDRWYPLRFSAGAPLRPAGSLRLRILRTADVRSVCLDAARGLLERAEAETRALLTRVQARMVELGGGGGPGTTALVPASAAAAAAAAVVSSGAGSGEPGAQPASSAASALYHGEDDGVRAGQAVPGVGPTVDIASRVRAERAAAASDGRRVVGMQLEVSVIEARGLPVSVASGEGGQEAGVAEVYATLRAGHVTR